MEDLHQIPTHVTGRSGPVQGLRVLLVEDNLVNQIVACTLLKHLGHVTTVAVNGAEAVEAVQREPYDLIFMDIQMPVMDGSEATACIRGLSDLPAAQTPIVALTAHAIEGYRERCLEAGMDEYVTKPISGRKLSEILDRLSELRSQRQQTPAPEVVI